jgi:hypothetical protein
VATETNSRTVARVYTARTQNIIPVECIRSPSRRDRWGRQSKRERLHWSRSRGTGEGGSSWSLFLRLRPGSFRQAVWPGTRACHTRATATCRRPQRPPQVAVVLDLHVSGGPAQLLRVGRGATSDGLRRLPSLLCAAGAWGLAPAERKSDSLFSRALPLRCHATM